VASGLPSTTTANSCCWDRECDPKPRIP
jgi:hypothetical protein